MLVHTRERKLKEVGRHKREEIYKRLVDTRERK